MVLQVDRRVYLEMVASGVVPGGLGSELADVGAEDRRRGEVRNAQGEKGVLERIGGMRRKITLQLVIGVKPEVERPEIDVVPVGRRDIETANIEQAEVPR